MKLKPCPFCGGNDAELVAGDYHGLSHGALCLRCGASVNSDESERKAIRNWNMRKQPTKKGET